MEVNYAIACKVCPEQTQRFCWAWQSRALTTLGILVGNGADVSEIQKVGVTGMKGFTPNWHSCFAAELAQRQVWKPSHGLVFFFFFFFHFFLYTMSLVAFFWFQVSLLHHNLVPSHIFFCVSNLSSHFLFLLLNLKINQASFFTWYLNLGCVSLYATVFVFIPTTELKTFNIY